MKTWMVVVTVILVFVFGYLALYNAANWGIVTGEKTCLALAKSSDQALVNDVDEAVARRHFQMMAFAWLAVIAAVVAGVGLHRRKS